MTLSKQRKFTFNSLLEDIRGCYITFGHMKQLTPISKGLDFNALRSS